MVSRYDNRPTAINRSTRDEKLFEKRGIKFINQFKTARLNYPSVQERAMLSNSPTVVWKMGNRFYKMANEYYGNPKYWWLIAWYNQAPTESHIPVGVTIKIPMPFDKAYAIYLRNGG